MEKKILAYYIMYRLRSAEMQLAAYAKDQKPERLHRLRIAIKKIKAVLSFAKKLTNKNHAPMPLKPLFDEAGAIRELQINCRLLASIPDPPKRLITKLQNKESRLTLQLINHIPAYLVLLKKCRNEMCLPKLPNTKKPIRKYCIKQLRKANKLLKNEDQRSLHRYRMKLKKILYFYNALPEKNQKEMKLNEAAMQAQGEKLGDWHDLYAAITFLSKERLPFKTRDYFEKLKEKEAKEFEALRTQYPDFSI